MTGQRPAHDPGGSIRRPRQAQKLRPGRHVGDVGHPIGRPGGADVPLHQGGRRTGRLAARRGPGRAVATSPFAAGLLHQLRHPLVPDPAPAACNPAWMRGRPYTSWFELQIAAMRSSTVHPTAVAVTGYPPARATEIASRPSVHRPRLATNTAAPRTNLSGPAAGGSTPDRSPRGRQAAYPLIHNE